VYQEGKTYSTLGESDPLVIWLGGGPGI